MHCQSVVLYEISLQQHRQHVSQSQPDPSDPETSHETRKHNIKTGIPDRSL